ncbi:MAG: protein phosphatase 2C domain-containing protein [Ktedonobacterales bacterium]
MDEHDQQGAEAGQDDHQDDQQRQAQKTQPLTVEAEATPAVMPSAMPAATPAGAREEAAALPSADPNVAAQPPLTDAMDTAEATPTTTMPAAEELAPGARIGAWRILGPLTSDMAQTLEGTVFEAAWAGAGNDITGANDEWDAPTTPLGAEAHYAVVARTGEISTDLAHLVAKGLQHPRLLAPRALVSTEAHTYLVVELAPTTHPAPDEQGEHQDAAQPARLVSRGAQLAPTEALRACAGLAHALSYLHRNGVAHLHVSPDTILVADGRAYLAGIERATVVSWDTSETAPLFARDANFLARTLGAMTEPHMDAGQAGESSSESLAARAAHEIVAQGEAGSFTSVDEVAAACGIVIQTHDQALGGAATPPLHLRISVGTASDVGRVRSENQDAFGVSFFQVHDDCGSPSPLGVFLVADGMGGEAHGEIASRIAARTVIVEMARHFTLPTLIWPVLALLGEPDAGENGANGGAHNGDATSDETSGGLPSVVGATLAQALADAANEANRQTRLFAQHIGATTGSTLTALAVSGAHAALAHIGDSRAYLLREGRFLQLTEDHSLLARLEAIDHPLLSDPNFIMPRSVLYRSLGQEEDAAPDMFEFTLNAHDRLLICSDGLWDELSDATLEVELAAATTPLACAERLVALANAAGGNDNSTVVALFVADPAQTDAADATNSAATTADGAANTTGAVGVGDTAQ